MKGLIMHRSRKLSSRLSCRLSCRLCRWVSLVLLLATVGCDYVADRLPVRPAKYPQGETWTVHLEFAEKLTQDQVIALLAPVWTEDLKPHTHYPPLVGPKGSRTAMVLVWDVAENLDVKKFLQQLVELPGIRTAKCNSFMATASGPARE